jgi:hypothetical protein
MKGLLIVILVVVAWPAALAAPAAAWYAPAERTAYIDLTGGPTGWIEWAGRDDPSGMIVHKKDPIPHDWEVVVATCRLDAEPGVRLAPLVFCYTAAFKRTHGPWGFRLLSPERALKCWSPAYQRDPATAPRVWARDWSVRLGQLPSGGYTGWIKACVSSAFPTWMDENGTILDEPVWCDASVRTYKHTFAVK